jgi:hypothetical protein
MDQATQERVSKLLTEQAEKLGKALSALRKIKLLPMLENQNVDASKIASDTLREISDYGKNPKDL